MKSIVRKVTSAAVSAAMMLTLTPAFEITSSAASSVPSGFVYTQGTEFRCDGSPYYYGGTNCYYLTYKSKEAVDNVMKDCNDMGLNVIRVWGFIDAGVKTDQVTSQGYPVFQNSADGAGEKDGVYFQYFDKSKGRPVVNEGEDGLQRLDYVIAQAEKHNIKLIIAFTNFWKDFGGMEQYAKWMNEAGLGNNINAEDFYTNETMKGWYKDYVNTLLNHTNVYTGKKLKDSEGVFAWELCNEPRAEKSDNYCKNNVLYNWAKEMSEYVKSVDPYHMVSVGDEGFYNFDRQGDIMQNQVDSDYAFSGNPGVDFDKLMSIDTIDFGTPHFYCDSWSLKIDGTGENGGDDDIDWLKLHAESAEKANKPVILEEFGLKDKTIRDEKYKSWLDLMDGTTFDGKYTYDGFNYWMIASYLTSDRTYSASKETYYHDYDGYTVYGPAEVEAALGTPNARNYLIQATANMNAKNICNLFEPESYKFDKSNAQDITATASMKTGSLTGELQLDGKTLVKGTDYTISGNTVTVKKSFLSNLSLAKYKFKAIATDGNNPSFTITVADANVKEVELDSYSATVDKNVKKCKYLSINMTLNGNTLKGVKYGTKELTKGSDYTVSGSTLVISKSFLTTLKEGDAVLTLDFDPASDISYTITVEDTTGNDELDTFESYSSSNDLWSAYTRNTGGDEVSLDVASKNGSKALKYGYNIGGNGYCGVTKNLGGKNFSSFKGIALWVEGDGSGNEITIQLKDSNGTYKESYIKLDFTGGNKVFLPFSKFVNPSWQSNGGDLDTSKIAEYSIYAGGSGKTSGTVYFDDIIAADGIDDVDTKDISTCTVSLREAAEFTGLSIKPTVKVKDGTTTLKNGRDYTVTYSDNKQVGTATVTITGKGNYEGTVVKTFKIIKKSVETCDVTLSKTSASFNNTAIKPEVTVKIGDEVINSRNYDVKYANNVNVGKATVTITGKNNLKGKVTKTFRISARSLSKCKISLSGTSFKYTGSEIKPKVTVGVTGSDKAVSSSNYTVTYSNNVKKGTATVTITGKGNLKDTVTKEFTIK